jgi:hypothetical protein
MYMPACVSRSTCHAIWVWCTCMWGWMHISHAMAMYIVCMHAQMSYGMSFMSCGFETHACGGMHMSACMPSYGFGMHHAPWIRCTCIPYMDLMQMHRMHPVTWIWCACTACIRSHGFDAHAPHASRHMDLMHMHRMHVCAWAEDVHACACMYVCV